MSKKLNKKEFAKEVGMVASIMADHVSEKLYTAMQSKGSGYMATHEQIADWAVQFVEEHENTNWEDLLDGNTKPKSKEVGSIFCWDDAVIDFAFYKLHQLTK